MSKAGNLLNQMVEMFAGSFKINFSKNHWIFPTGQSTVIVGDDSGSKFCNHPFTPKVMQEYNGPIHASALNQ